MTSTVTLAPAPAAPAAVDRPHLGAIVKHVSINVTVACGVPAALFYVCVVLAGPWTAILVALAWSYGAVLWRRVTGRPASGLLYLIAVLMTGRTLLALGAESTFVYFLQPVITDGLLGGVFLASLATARPLVARLAGDFYPMDDDIAARPRVRRLFARLTVLWGALCLVKAGTTLWLLLSQSLTTFVLIKGLTVFGINVLAVAATIATAAVVARKEGLLGQPPAVALA